MTAGISVIGLTKTYGDHTVLDDLHLTFEAGKIHGLLGANGTGKTTLMSLMSRHTFPTRGSVLLDDREFGEDPRQAQRLCFIRENQLYNDAFKVRDVLRIAPTFYPTWDAATTTRLVDRFRLPPATVVKKLSRGQRSALAIVLALGSRADFTFLDEPYLGLDPGARETFYEELIRSYGAQPRTIIMSTHLVDEAAPLLEEVVVLNQGRVALQAPLDEAESLGLTINGSAVALDGWLRDHTSHQELTRRTLGPTATVTTLGPLTEAARQAAETARLRVSPTSLQGLVAALGNSNHEAA
ncbi:ABC transporter ATP-binding protein [Nostocoides jenkinsii]|uniref:Putative ABC transporter ATP-binding protein n=1 Tax=Nostocoides jenkinsii Ben 74 TaxID=1193518 RepID=A0A077M4A2_9MICO|nr:ABC transporter ATP-binding protein [Tetrasphaera jenkinsii]CCI51354.1 putative ABC transporter ATP-binding protein [Tetrasphaera jenkinsii Ben 74]